MGVAIITKAIETIKSISDLSSKVLDAADPEKYAKSVDELCNGVDDTYVSMRKIIIESEEFTEEEKLEKLNALAEQEIKTNEICGAAIRGNRENVAKITLEIFKGFLTCGLYFVPAMIKKLKTEIFSDKEIETLTSMTDSNELL